MHMIGACIFSSIFITIGATALIYNFVLNQSSGLFFLIWGGVFFLSGVKICYESTIAGIKSQKNRLLYNYQSLDWYKKSHPQAALSSNIFQCYACKSRQINRYLVKNNSYKVCNYCANCGEVLFYTDER